MRPSFRITAGVAELTVHRRIPSSTCAGCWIDHRDKGIGIEPLFRTCYGHARDWILGIDGYARQAIGISWRVELCRARSVRLKDPLAVCNVRLAQHTERESGVHKRSLGKRPPFENLPQNRMAETERHLIQAKSRNVVAHVVVAACVLAAQLSRERRH